MKRKFKKCLMCSHLFKNYKWRRSFKYDGWAAACPNCDVFVIEWKKP